MNLGAASQFLWGALTLGCLVATLLFARAWRASRDRLFMFLATAFFVLALNWLGLAVLHPLTETRHHVFLLRLLAFVLIIVGIIDKNRTGSSR
ncbi:MAG TPA: DUF5985 family protein [Polyangia bacterium]|jgi:hypothetical protein